MSAINQALTEKDPRALSHPPRTTFSRELRELGGRFADRPVQIGELLEATQGRGFNLLLVLVALPFLTPIPMPGFSIPFGLLMTVIGTRLALGRKPWLPKKLLLRKLPAGLLVKVLAVASRVLSLLEWFLRPRLTRLLDLLFYRRMAGILIAWSGLYLLLPLPVPFSNGLPAWTVLLLSAAALERDGLCFIAGCVLFLIVTTFFLMLAIGGVHGVEYLRQSLFHSGNG